MRLDPNEYEHLSAFDVSKYVLILTPEIVAYRRRTVPNMNTWRSAIKQWEDSRRVDPIEWPKSTITLYEEIVIDGKMFVHATNDPDRFKKFEISAATIFACELLTCNMFYRLSLKSRNEWRRARAEEIGVSVNFIKSIELYIWEKKNAVIPHVPMAHMNVAGRVVSGPVPEAIVLGVPLVNNVIPLSVNPNPAPRPKVNEPPRLLPLKPSHQPNTTQPLYVANFERRVLGAQSNKNENQDRPLQHDVLRIHPAQKIAPPTQTMQPDHEPLFQKTNKHQPTSSDDTFAHVPREHNLGCWSRITILCVDIKLMCEDWFYNNCRRRQYT
jgi:hypothetical protein